MDVMAQFRSDDPVMIAWRFYFDSEDCRDVRKLAQVQEHVLKAFLKGYSLARPKASALEDVFSITDVMHAELVLFVDTLMDAKIETKEGFLLSRLADTISKYEAKRYPEMAPRPIDVPEAPQ